MAIVRTEIQIQHQHFFGKKPEKEKRQYNCEPHRAMCKRAAQWLRSSMGCNFAVWELTAMASEKPDAIGWHPYKSTLVECKTSRADFLRDAKKYHKKTADSGMGNYRYYMCPPDIIKVDDLPPLWGLLYLNANRVSIIKRAEKQKSNLNAERAFLVSIARRSESGCNYLQAKISDEQESPNDAK